MKKNKQTNKVRGKRNKKIQRKIFFLYWETRVHGNNSKSPVERGGEGSEDFVNVTIKFTWTPYKALHNLVPRSYRVTDWNAVFWWSLPSTFIDFLWFPVYSNYMQLSILKIYASNSLNTRNSEQQNRKFFFITERPLAFLSEILALNTCFRYFTNVIWITNQSKKTVRREEGRREGREGVNGIISIIHPSDSVSNNWSLICHPRKTCNSLAPQKKKKNRSININNDCSLRFQISSNVKLASTKEKYSPPKQEKLLGHNFLFGCVFPVRRHPRCGIV